MRIKLTNKIQVRILENFECDLFKANHNFTNRIEMMSDKFDIKTHWTCLQGAWHEVGCQCNKAKFLMTTTATI